MTVTSSGLGRALRATALSGLGGALRAPLGPVVAPLVPRCALLPAPTPRMMGFARRVPCRFRKVASQGVEMFRQGTVGDLSSGDLWRSIVVLLVRQRNRIGMSSIPSAANARSASSAGGGGGKECAARHERSNDWPQGGAQRSP